MIATIEVIIPIINRLLVHAYAVEHIDFSGGAMTGSYDRTSFIPFAATRSVILLPERRRFALEVVHCCFSVSVHSGNDIWQDNWRTNGPQLQLSRVFARGQL